MPKQGIVTRKWIILSFILFGSLCLFFLNDIENVTAANWTSMEIHFIFRHVNFVIYKPFFQTLFMKFMAIQNTFLIFL